MTMMIMKKRRRKEEDVENNNIRIMMITLKSLIKQKGMALTDHHNYE